MAANGDVRRTRQRTAILEELHGTRTHPTADELHDVVRARLPRISLATVYRNLQMLAGRGVIRKLSATGGPMRFDANTAPHLHIRCVRCGRVDDVADESCRIDRAEVERTTGYRMTGREVVLLGLCPDCRDET